jgi:hypothetical protein
MARTPAAVTAHRRWMVTTSSVVSLPSKRGLDDSGCFSTGESLPLQERGSERFNSRPILTKHEPRDGGKPREMRAHCFVGSPTTRANMVVSSR